MKAKPLVTGAYRYILSSSSAHTQTYTPTWLLGAEERVPLVYIIMEICPFYPAPPSPKLFGHHNCPHHNSPALNDKNLIALSVSPLSSPNYIFFSTKSTQNWGSWFDPCKYATAFYPCNLARRRVFPFDMAVCIPCEFVLVIASSNHTTMLVYPK